MTTITHNNHQITFNPLNHTYTDNKESIYTPVTGFVSNLFPKFETDIVAERYAKKYNLIKEEVINQWDKISKAASELGHNNHEHFKNLLLNKSNIQIKSEYKKEIDKIYQSIIKHKLILVNCEKIIFSPILKIAGTYDSLFMSENKDRYYLFDWKFCKKIEFKNNWNSYAFKPIQHLHDCNYVHYSLQLSLYKYILKKENYVDNRLPIISRIIHIKPNESRSYHIKSVDKELESVLFK